MAHRIVCDFCSSPRPRWRFPTKSFVAMETRFCIDESKGDWAACDLCKEMIDANNLEGLAERSIESLVFLHPEILMLPEGSVGAFKGRLRSLHKQFIENRIGAQVVPLV